VNEKCLKELILEKAKDFPEEARDDLAKGIRELIEVENHIRYTYVAPRERSDLWCANKHLLSASKRAEEVGDKLLDADFDERIRDMFYQHSLILYEYFHALASSSFKKEFIPGMLKKIREIRGLWMAFFEPEEIHYTGEQKFQKQKK